MKEDEINEYKFSNDWFKSTGKEISAHVMGELNPVNILEIGSYEGQSTVFFIESLKRDGTIVCVDSWAGGVEHEGSDFNEIEERFKYNTALACSKSKYKVNVVPLKGLSITKLCELVTSGFSGKFDLIYVDGSHQAPDVLSDALLAFNLLRVNGVMIFDDYIWSESIGPNLDPLRSPKCAIDAFTNIFIRKLKVVPVPFFQFCILKIAN
jgi:predicted O-methyltransferase YrrM